MNANASGFPRPPAFAANAAERPRRPLGRLVPNPKLKFLDPCREVLRFKQYALRTEQRQREGPRRRKFLAGAIRSLANRGHALATQSKKPRALCEERAHHPEHRLRWPRAHRHAAAAKGKTPQAARWCFASTPTATTQCWPPRPIPNQNPCFSSPTAPNEHSCFENYATLE